MYEYKATVLKVIDGDTLDLKVDLGLRIFNEIRVRLYGINAPEMNTDAGKHAKEFLTGLISGREVVIKTFKDKTEKYGRYLVIVSIEDIEINTLMVSSGHAEFKSY